MKNHNLSLIFLLLFLFFSKSIIAQNKIIDSLENKLLKHKAIDSVKVNLLNTLAFKYRSYNIVKAEEKALEANSLAKDIGFIKGEARSVLVFNMIHTDKGEYDEALTDALKSLELYKKINNNYGISATYISLGTISIHKSDINNALKYFNKGLDVATEMNHIRLQSDILNNIGGVYYHKGDLDDAVNYFKKSNVLGEKSGNKKRILRTSNNIAVIYAMQGRTIESLEYFNKSLLIQREDNNKREIASTTLNIGGVYWENEQPEKALIYLQESLYLSKELKDKQSIAKCLVSIGAIYEDSKEYPEALNYLTEALTINTDINNKHGLITCNKQIGDLRLSMKQPQMALNNFKYCLDLSSSINDKVNICYSQISLAEAYLILKNYAKALHHGLKGEKMADSLELLSQQKKIDFTLSKIYESTGQFKKSLSHFKNYKTLNDSLFNKENIEKITQLEYEYKYKKALDSASIRELKLTKTVKSTSQNLEKSQRNLLLGVIAFLTMILILGTIIFFLKLRHAKSKTQNIAIEQKLLRSQMTPHFIFNSLSVLQGMILNKEDKKSVFYLSKFSKLLRLTLENSRDKIVPLQQELEAVSNYLELQNLEESQSFEYTILVDKTIDESVLNVPPMLIQPFIENAVEHAFKNQKENRKIDILLKYSNGELICTITDNGIGVNSQNGNKNKHKKSLATTITTERLKVLSKDFKMKGSINIEDRQKYNEQGTIVTLVIPYKKNEA